jgi:hypothetical protein
MLMKRILIALAVCVLFIVAVSSCSGAKKCPAYSQNNTAIHSSETVHS